MYVFVFCTSKSLDALYGHLDVLPGLSHPLGHVLGDDLDGGSILDRHANEALNLTRCCTAVDLQQLGPDDDLLHAPVRAPPIGKLPDCLGYERRRATVTLRDQAIATAPRTAEPAGDDEVAALSG